MKKLILFFLLCASAWASKTTLTGTLTDAQGNLINGMLVMQLPVPAQDTTTNVIVTNTPVFFRLVNGAVTGGAQLYDTATLQPLNLYYIASAYDTTGTKVFGGNFKVTGATYNLGTAIPTSVTTSNVNYAGVCTSSGCGVNGLNLGNNQLIFGLGQITAGLNTGYDLGFTAAGSYRFGSAAVNGWTAGLPTAALDTGLSRCAAGVTCAGNGAQGDASGTVKATNLLAPAGSNLAIPTVGANVVSDTATQTLSAKTLTSPVINGTPTGTGIPTVTLKKGSGAGDYTSASLTYVVVDSTNLCQTVTIPTGWKLLINVSGGITSQNAAVSVLLALTDNASCATPNAGILTERAVLQSSFGSTESVGLAFVINGDGASHSVALQFKTTNAADSVLLGNGTATGAPTMTTLLTPSN